MDRSILGSGFGISCGGVPTAVFGIVGDRVLHGTQDHDHSKRGLSRRRLPWKGLRAAVLCQLSQGLLDAADLPQLHERLASHRVLEVVTKLLRDALPGFCAPLVGISAYIATSILFIDPSSGPDLHVQNASTASQCQQPEQVCVFRFGLYRDVWDGSFLMMVV